MISSIVSRLVILVFGTLYPAYASYKAVRSRDVREYVKWMMYWIVFALFTCGETITDVFLSFWFPFYYEIKIGFVLWLLSPATKGSSILYRKFVHPMLTNREQEIDEYIARAKEQGYHTVLHLGSKGVNYATNVIMQTAIKGGGGLVNQLRKSYSLSDLTEGEGEPVRDINRNGKDVDGIEYRGNRRPDRVDGPRSSNRARGYSPRRSASGSARMEMYFPEVDLDVRQRRGSSRSREASVPLSHIRSSEDVSSGYTSSDHFYEDAQMELDTGTSEDCASIASSEGPLVRTASVGSTRSTRTKGSASTRSTTASTTTTATKKATQGEMDESSSEEEDLWSDPMDNVAPLLDRTIFVNDLNLFPINETKVEVSIISSSAELIHLSSSDSGNVNADTTSVPNLQEEDEKLNKSGGNQEDINEVSSSNKFDESNQDSKTENPILEESLSSDLSLDVQPHQIASPECLLSDESGSETLSACTEKLASGEKTIDDNVQEILSDVAKDVNESEISIESLSISLLADTVASDENIKESTCAVASSVNAANTDLDPTSKEAEDISIDDSLLSLESTTTPASTAPVNMEKTKCFVLGDIVESTTAPVSTASVNIEPTKCFVLEDIAMDNSGVSKEEHPTDSRGGKYNKRPAPVPPKLADESKGLNQDKDGDALHARLVLKRGVVRSLPDVGLALSDSLIKSEVFMPLGTSKHSPPIPSPRSKHENKEKFLDGKDSSKIKSETGIGLPHFLNISRHPHFGSLTSIFPFWQGAHSSSSDTHSVATSEKLDESISKSKKSVEGNRASNVTPLKNVVLEDKTNEKSQAGDASTSSARGRDESKKNFPVRQLSQSPSRTKRRF